MTDLYVDQADDETVTVGPIIAADGSYLAVIPATFSTSLVVKANKTATDASGITYAGTFSGSNAFGWVATFTIPKADIAVLGSRWYRCRVVDTVGKVQTAASGRFIVDTGRGQSGPAVSTPSQVAVGLAEHFALADPHPAHGAAPDPHPGYRLESVPITAADVAADLATQGELDGEAAARAAADSLLIPLAQKAAANGVATLDGGSKILAAQLPSIAISDFLGTVASQAAMLALVGQAGDWCNRSDLSQSFIIVTGTGSLIGDWQVLLTPADAVSSVNGRNGAVTGLAEQTSLDTTNTTVAGKQAADADLSTIAALDATVAGALATDGAGWVRKSYAALKTALGLVKADVGLGSVDNTADTAKPVSTDQAAANALRIPLTQKGAANGVATLDAASKIPAVQLPASSGGDAISLNTYAPPTNATFVTVVTPTGDMPAAPWTLTISGDNTSWPTSGLLALQTSQGDVSVAYTGKTSTTFTGCDAMEAAGMTPALTLAAGLKVYRDAGPAIQAFGDAVKLVKGEGTLPPGVYRVCGTLNFDQYKATRFTGRAGTGGQQGVVIIFTRSGDFPCILQRASAGVVYTGIDFRWSSPAYIGDFLKIDWQCPTGFLRVQQTLPAVGTTFTLTDVNSTRYFPGGAGTEITAPKSFFLKMLDGTSATVTYTGLTDTTFTGCTADKAGQTLANSAQLQGTTGQAADPNFFNPENCNWGAVDVNAGIARSIWSLNHLIISKAKVNTFVYGSVAVRMGPSYVIAFAMDAPTFNYQSTYNVQADGAIEAFSWSDPTFEPVCLGRTRGQSIQANPQVNRCYLQGEFAANGWTINGATWAGDVAGVGSVKFDLFGQAINFYGVRSASNQGSVDAALVHIRLRNCTGVVISGCRPEGGVAVDITGFGQGITIIGNDFTASAVPVRTNGVDGAIPSGKYAALGNHGLVNRVNESITGTVGAGANTFTATQTIAKVGAAQVKIIDTTSTQQNTDIGCSVAGAAAFFISNVTAGTTPLLLAPNGHFGIGATTPLAMLHGKAAVVSDVALIAEGISGQTADIQQARLNGAITERVGPAGYRIIKRIVVPADADLGVSELALWLDNTPGATKVMLKAKDSAGTVRTGSVPLA